MSATIIAANLKRFGALSFLNEDEQEKLIRRFTLVKSGAGSKYHNMIVEYDGERFHSLSEAYYWHKLKTLKNTLKIQKQVVYPLQDMMGGSRLRYVADFVITTNTGNEYVIDVKGRLTPENKIKLAYYRYVYNKPVYIVETAGLLKFDVSFIA